MQSVQPLIAMLDGGAAVQTRATGMAERVPLPILPVGRHILQRLKVHEEPAGASWRDPDYCSVNPFVAHFADVRVHGPEGIVATDRGVVAETLWQTDERAGYVRQGASIGLAPPVRSRHLAGPALSLLGGNVGNVYHWLLEGVGRLAAADATALAGCSHLLVPEPTAPFHHAAIVLAGLEHRWKIETVGPRDVWHVGSLVVPWTMTGHHRPHPALASFFAPITAMALAATSPWPGDVWPRRIYVDRRGSAHRRLSNETALIEALSLRGFQPVRLETLPLAMQIALFARAEVIVAPHGAGLAHVLHAQPGCRLLELHMDSWVNWCVRRLAAICGVAYDCVVGREDAGLQPAWVHARSWSVSLTHLMAALDHALVS